MIQSARQRKKKQKDMLGMLGIVLILGLGGFGFYFYDSNSNPLDANNCSIKNGPNAVTAIIFDKSQKYSTEQVTDIKLLLIYGSLEKSRILKKKSSFRFF